MMEGVININKEAGYTSSDVVTILRGILRIKKIGHTGTLDPGATGVLPMCIGKATRLVEMLMDHDKEYVARMLFGRETDTGDLSGKTTVEKAYTFDPENFRKAVARHTGDILQIPPMYSAVKVGGVRLYDLAHEGIEVQRQARAVHVERIEIMELTEQGATLRINCSKGTYIRTLIEDIGRSCGMLGVMSHLTRTRSGSFYLEDALTLAQVKALYLEGRLETYVHPIEHFFMDLPSYTIKAEQELLLKNGNPMELEVQNADRIRMYDLQNQFKAIYKLDPAQEIAEEGKYFFRPEKMF